jgi:endonuclease/exonuclease/phosphatase family metal-dependent hydrolase
MAKRDAVVRVMTWNIHGGGPSRRDRDLERIVSLVRRHDPDIVALQEVDARGLISPGPPAFEFLRDALGSHAAEARIIAAPDGDFGHAVISRWPLGGTVRHDVSVVRREPRAAIETTAQTEHGPLHIIATHLGLSFRERRHQARLLADVARGGPKRSIVLGDFNDWLWRGAVERSLSRALPDRTRHLTFPARRPIFDLDRVYARPAGTLLRSWTDPRARLASDHLPVIADLAMTAA